MWAAFRNDLSEFVSTVSEDTTQVLSKIDQNLQDQEYQDDEEDGGEDEEGLVASSSVVTKNQEDAEEKTTSEGQEEKDGDCEAAEGGEGKDGGEPEDGRNKKRFDDAGGKNNRDVMVVSTDGEDGGFLVSPGKAGVGGFEETGIVATADDEVARRRGDIKTYTEELPDTFDSKAFLAGFDPSDEAQTDIIAQTLKSYPDTVEAYFTELVPTQISYEQFWARYFYRCNEEQVERDWEVEREERARARRETREKLVKNAQAGLGFVGNLVGNALHAVVGDADGDGGEGGSEHGADDKAQPSTSAATMMGMSGLMMGGRPPFVLQSNDSGDDDEEVVGGGAQDDEDSEEELGWDDDDDDDDDEEDDVNESRTSEEVVEFATADGTSAEQRLKLSEVESAQLRQTIDTQKREIETLQAEVAAAGRKDDAQDTSSSKEPDDDAYLGKCREVDQLQMAVFEKDSELAALRAKMDDHTQEEDSPKKPSASDAELAAALQEVEQVRTELAEKDGEIARLLKAVESAQAAASGVAASSSGATDEMTSLISTLQAEVSEKDFELSALREQVSVESSKQDAVVSSLKEQLDAAERKAKEAEETMKFQQDNFDEARSAIRDLSKELSDLNKQYQSSMEEVKELRMEREELLAKAQQVKPPTNPEATKLSPSPDSSLSSGVVKLEEPSAKPTALQANNNGGDEEDDWGDSWGDDADLDL